MIYLKAYLRTVAYLLAYLSAAYLVLNFSSSLVFMYFCYMALMAGIAGPISVWFNKRVT